MNNSSGSQHNVGAQRAVPRDGSSNDQSRTERHRRSVRLNGFDYRAEGAYFVTVVTHERKPLFGRVTGDLMALNDFGDAVRDEWARIALLRPYVLLDEFVVMPDHVHGILWITDNGAFHGQGTARCAPTAGDGEEDATRRFGEMVPRSLPAIVRAFKSAASRRVNLLGKTPGDPVWQRNYYERVIRNDRELHDIRRYIIDNPAKWAYDREWIAQGALT
jgi:REP element-mobilizing transposase RayT